MAGGDCLCKEMVKKREAKRLPLAIATVSIRFGDNFLDRDTALVTQKFVIGNVISLLLMF